MDIFEINSYNGIGAIYERYLRLISEHPNIKDNELMVRYAVKRRRVDTRFDLRISKLLELNLIAIDKAPENIYFITDKGTDYLENIKEFRKGFILRQVLMNAIAILIALGSLIVTIIK